MCGRLRFGKSFVDFFCTLLVGAAMCRPASNNCLGPGAVVTRHGHSRMLTKHIHTAPFTTSWLVTVFDALFERGQTVHVEFADEIVSADEVITIASTQDLNAASMERCFHSSYFCKLE